MTRFISISNKFEFKPVDVIQLGNVKKKFALLNDQKTIQFDSLITYDTVKLADIRLSGITWFTGLPKELYNAKEWR